MRIAIGFLIALTTLSAAELKLGKPLSLTVAVPVDTILAKPSDYVGKTVQVKGRITEVCQAMGCWMNLAGEDGAMIRIKVNDGELEFPRDSVGKSAVAEGTLKRIEMTREQAAASAKHEAEEMGRKFDPASVKIGKTIYQIQGSGAVILANGTR